MLSPSPGKRTDPSGHLQSTSRILRYHNYTSESDEDDTNELDSWADLDLRELMREIICRKKCLVLGLFFLAWASTFALTGAVVLPWDKAPRNPKLHHELKMRVASNRSMVTICRFKQYLVPSLHWKFFDFFGVWHHEGMLFEFAPSDISPREFLYLDYGHYGMRWHWQHSSEIWNLYPWAQDCKYICGSLPSGWRSPQKLIDFLHHIQYWHYNGFRFNCMEFAGKTWDHFPRTQDRCGPDLPPSNTKS